MNRFATALATVALVAALGVPGSHAFQEQGGKATTQAGAAVAPPTTSALPRTGTEVRIPGLGQIGALPKFDFGLELLYGASEPKGVREELSKTDQNDLQIRGSLRFKLPN